MSVTQSTKSGKFPENIRNERIDRTLANLLPELSRERIKNLILGKCLSLDGVIHADPAFKKHAGQQFELTIAEVEEGPAKAQDIPLNVVFEDRHLIIVNKPAGMVVHPAAGHADGTLVNALLYHCAGQLSGIGGVMRPGIVHRIDKDTSGLLVSAKDDATHQGLSALFAAHDIDRRYVAIVHGLPKPLSGAIEGNIGRSPYDRKKMAVVPSGKGKTAVTHYATLDRLKGAALVECKLETGRTHQVRVHMAHLGHSLIGDPLYGKRGKSALLLPKGFRFCRQALHAASLGFKHPITGEKLHFNSDLPADMQHLFSILKL